MFGFLNILYYLCERNINRVKSGEKLLNKNVVMLVPLN